MKKSYAVTSPIKCGGKRYAVGSTIDLEEGEAAKLREAIGDEIASQGGGQASADGVDRFAAIGEAVGRLDPDDKVLWLKNGAPKTEAIAAITGWPVTAADRDAVWVLMGAAQ